MLSVSLIMTTYNSRENFIKSYESIMSQTYPEIEVVIVDGESSDGTREEIKKRAEINPAVTWISEKDSGIYNALNKGIRMSKGDVIAIFNDQYLCNDAVEQYVHAIEACQSDGVHSDLVYLDAEGKKIRRWKMGQGDICQGWMPGHPTLYLKRQVYEKYGLYKENYHCAADYEFMVRILKDGNAKLAYIPKELIGMYYGGTSNSSLKAYAVSFCEGIKALEENQIKGAVGITLRRMIKVLRQFRE